MFFQGLISKKSLLLFVILNENQHVYIPKETLHRMENIGEAELEFVETQIGSYLGEDDIVRYEDDFGRK